jgi:hypothetical protein
MLKGHACPVVLLDPFFRGVHICEHLDVLGIAGLLTRVDLVPLGFPEQELRFWFRR